VIDWQAVSAARLPFVVGACLPGVVAPSAIAEGRWVPRAACMPDAPLPARQRRRTGPASVGGVAKVGPSGPPCQTGTDKMRSASRGRRVTLTPCPEIQARRTDAVRPKPDGGWPDG
jgi:hypothetical protein